MLSATGVSPAELLFGRSLRTNLPCLGQLALLDGEVRDRQLVSQQKSRDYTNAKKQEDEVQVGGQGFW